MNDIARKMEEIFVAAQRVQDLVMEFGAIAARLSPESGSEESTQSGASS